ncbi:hypothetical protein PV327_008374 [Microctonus hyperodae]|uniref:Protein-serine O-palmitoleoyltransferase porcupine n=1 Tax=Microctonus hyperodae TaxID=165561 RepID=A0AA39F2Y3_MICHY|nr:hypothetical protein PV327_008374 [Microctonus hyperodae]
MFDADIDDMTFYDDDDDHIGDCVDCDKQNFEYDYDYDEIQVESLEEIINNCLIPSVFDTTKYLIPLFIISLSFNFITQFVKLPQKYFHILSILLGMFILHYYVPESLYLIEIYAVLSYICLCLPKQYQKGIEMFVLSLLIILYCEYTMEPVAWHKIRSVIMIAAMKAVSVSLDKSDDLPDVWQYIGYMFSPVTCLFGPWIPFSNYISVEQNNNRWTPWFIVSASKNLLISLIFLSVSNCWTRWLIPLSAGKWLSAYKDALSFRSSHYFISYMSSTILLLGGFSSSVSTIVRPIDIELPRSLVQVVVSWNIPMHTWLKLYIFRPATRHVGKFGAVTLTYLTSALLHGLNFQLAAVLLSLGLYTYVEFQLRFILANAFDACIGAKQCSPDKCHHKKNSRHYGVILTNIVFSILSVFHLAYLGLMFDISELQETGYSYRHTIDKWSQLGFASHWIAFTTYLIYFLIK